MPKWEKGTQCKSSCNELGKFAPSALRYWTATAVECYDSNFDCLHCRCYYLVESQECQMKAAVLELYRKFGEPTAENVRRNYEGRIDGARNRRSKRVCEDKNQEGSNESA